MHLKFRGQAAAGYRWNARSAMPGDMQESASALVAAAPVATPAGSAAEALSHHEAPSEPVWRGCPALQRAMLATALDLPCSPLQVVEKILRNLGVWVNVAHHVLLRAVKDRRQRLSPLWLDQVICRATDVTK
eukprot:CAMPEP_0170646510 /NCGR_PEP_ID=MMETSP0224-20130122/43678_1 /TAXON_ID=285029 /ORGANISM="Togula jolla, Strain CCCM 725" /LENGTH=131 /DNA_ID=CAMNT_0010977851 /DNA_START=184 /DNA_END=580 /DNA_ORIENTATION=-